MSNLRISAMASLVLALAVAAESAADQRAERSAQQGDQLLAEGNFAGALRAYAVAAKSDRGNREYLQRYAILRRVIELRRQLEQEQDAAAWERIARALHSFYSDRGLHSQMLSVDRQIHARLGTASSAVLLGQTQLAMKLNEEAAATFASVDPSQATPATRALWGVALARQGELDQARALADEISLPDEAGPNVLYAVARYYAATGVDERACVALTRCFEAVPPSRLAGFKDHARRCPDFNGLATARQFVSVLKTESKVTESKCSGGSSCAGCPMRGQCSGSQH